MSPSPRTQRCLVAKQPLGVVCSTRYLPLRCVRIPFEYLIQENSYSIYQIRSAHIVL